MAQRTTDVDGDISTAQGHTVTQQSWWLLLLTRILWTTLLSISRICSKAYSKPFGLDSPKCSCHYTAYSLLAYCTYLPCFQSTMKRANKDKPIQENYKANVHYRLGREMGGWEWFHKRKKHACTDLCCSSYSLCTPLHMFHFQSVSQAQIPSQGLTAWCAAAASLENSYCWLQSTPIHIQKLQDKILLHSQQDTIPKNTNISALEGNNT